jgi:CRP-like cAMP-binding protein
VLRTLCERLRATTLQLESVALMPLETRAARLLLAFARRSGAAGPDGRVRFPCDVSQSELAALVGASRPKLNRVLMQLEADGLLAREGRVYAVDTKGLAVQAAEERSWA